MQAQNFTSYIKLNKIGFLNKAVYRFVYKHFYKDVDAIHYPTRFIQNVFEKNVKHKTNGYVISNGVHSYVEKRKCEKPIEFQDKILILTTGRYAREKSQDTLLKSIKYSKYKDSIQLLGAIPVPSTVRGFRKFSEAVDLYHQSSNITIFPEAHIWPYYTGVRNFSDASFGYAVKHGCPVFAFLRHTQHRGVFFPASERRISPFM